MSTPIEPAGVVMVGDLSLPWRIGLTLPDVVRELGLAEGHPLADINGRFIWKKDWEGTLVPEGARVRFHWVIGGG